MTFVYDWQFRLFETAENQFYREKPGKSDPNLCAESGKGMGNSYQHLYSTEQKTALPLTNNRYFKTLEETLADEQLKKTPALRGYRTRRRCTIPTGWDYYQVTFDENDTVVSQKTNSLFDGS